MNDIPVEEQIRRAQALARNVLKLPSPCDNCWFKSCCREREMACQQYAGWAGFYRKSKRHWSKMNKYPRRDIYQLVWNPEDPPTPKRWLNT